MQKIRFLVEVVRRFGLLKSAFRAGHELKLRSGLEATIHPVQREAAGEAIDARIADRLHEYQTPLVKHFLGRDLARFQRATERERRVVHRLRAFEQGRLRMFGHWTADFRSPLDWHLNPWNGRRWPEDVHWSRALGAAPDVGDVKLTWELGRLPVAFDWGRAVSVGEAETARSQFARTLVEFERANPFRAGIHWASGQELAIRLIALWFAFGSCGGARAFESDTVERLVRQTRLHAVHIRDNISFARWAVPNNHLIGEALGLFLAGLLLEEHPEAGRWRKMGWKLLTKDGVDQFHPDGGYVQCSHNYHRLALHYLVWAVLLADLYGIEVPERLHRVLLSSYHYLLAQQASDGRLPNWGPNDGALLNPLSECDFCDFRPLLRTLASVLGVPSPYREGPWDEDEIWLVSDRRREADFTSLNTEEANQAPTFEYSGLYPTSGGGDSHAILRCGTVRSQFGHADQHHVDLWVGNVNVALDPGSYCYNDRLQYHQAFMSTATHNTVSLNGQSQMKQIRRFRWVYWPRADASSLEQSQKGQIIRVSGWHDGYCRPGSPNFVHERTVTWMTSDHVRIVDQIKPRRKNGGAGCRPRLHWLLADLADEIDLDEQPRVVLDLGERGKVEVTVEWTGLEEPDVAAIRAEEDGPRGWQSRHYGCLTPALSLSVEGRAHPPWAQFVTDFIVE